MEDLDETFRPLSKRFGGMLTDADAERLETQHQLRTSYACGYVSTNQAEKMNEKLLEIGRLLSGMIEKSSAFMISNDRVCEDPSIDELF